MSSAFLKIVSAIHATLLAQPRICAAIYRARSLVVPDQDDEAITVQPANALPSDVTISGAPIDWSTRISVECFARSVKDSGDIAVDPLLERVFERLAADSTLGGMVDDLIIAGIEWQTTSEGKKTGWVHLTYIALHRTSNLLIS